MPLSRFPKNANLLALARQLRKSQTPAEHLLWMHLRSRRFFHAKFKRQQSLGNYIVDFVCLEKMLIIECDGSQHAEQREEDKFRDLWFQEKGFKTLRFWNEDIFKRLKIVLETIWRHLYPPPPSACVVPQGGTKEAGEVGRRPGEGTKFCKTGR